MNQDNLSSNSFTNPVQSSFQSSNLRSASYNTPFNRLSEGFTQPGSNYSFKQSQTLPQQQPQQQQQQQQVTQQQNTLQARNESPTRPQQQIQVQPSMGTTRVISRNYLQIQPSNNPANKSATLNSAALDNLITNNTSANNITDPKRTRSISRSLRSLFTRPSSVSKIPSSQRRDKSYESPNNYNEQYDIQSGLILFE